MSQIDYLKHVNDPIYDEKNDDGWDEKLKDDYILTEEDEKIIPMTTTDVDYLNPYDIRNHSCNIITNMQDTPAQSVKKRKRKPPVRYSEYLSHEDTIHHLKKLSEFDKEDLIIDSDVDSPTTLLEAFEEVDNDINMNNPIEDIEDTNWEMSSSHSETENDIDTSSEDNNIHIIKTKNI